MLKSSLTFTALPEQEIAQEVRDEKYAKLSKATEKKETVAEIRTRVAKGLVAKEKLELQDSLEKLFHKAMENGFIPAGRISSAGGTDIEATLINCFVQGVADSISETKNGKPGIYIALKEAAETMRRGGGVGYNFSQIRPRNAKVKGTASNASGPVSYMRVFDRSCETVESAGARRGAQMGMLNDHHPDIEEFIHAKDKGDLTNFNISVAVSDAFMKRVEEDGDWELWHEAEPSLALQEKGAYQREDGKWVYQVVKAKDLWQQIMESTYDHAEPGVIFIDTANKKNNLRYCEVFEATNPCAEEFLPDYGCCCLGSINLTLFVRKPFTSEAYFDFDAFSQTIRPAIRMLDNVLDVTFWPLPQQKQEAQDKRRIGLGFTGLGNALAMLTLKYDTAEAQAMAKKIADFMTRESYLASVDLAREKGAFPKFVADKFLEEGTFASTLDADVKEAIRLHGIRNSHLNAIAPTGTISLAFADNASNGIEPPFSYTYQRKKRMSDGSVKVYDVEDYAYRLYRHLGGDVSKLPPYFTTALEIGTEGHLGMMTAVVNSIDTSVSKTVNVPEDYPYEEFKDLYFKAWRAGLKGLATYRPNSTLGSVLSVKEEKPKEEKVSAETFDQTDKDRRIVLKEAVAPALSSLKWPSRPETPQGNDSWTYMVYHQFGKFATIVGHLVGSKHPLPFEVWVTGSEIPRGLEAIAKSLSSDLRTQDRTWIDMKLSALSSLEGDDGFMMPFPPQGQEQWIPSTAAAVARIVQFRLSELLGPTTKAKSPMVDALFSKKKPKTGPEGTLSWTVDIYNPQTEEEFSVLLKEVVLPNGDTRPYAIELSGNYPKAYDGLMSMLSLDMRVIDPAWIGMKLRGLLDYAEPRGDFMAFNPFTGKQQTWASTLAYVATTVLFRYFKLGILTEEGYPVKDMGVLEKPEKPKRNAKPTTDNKVMGGKPCKECGQNAVIKKDGCQFCTACGWVGSCG